MFENVLIYLTTVFIIYFFWNCCKKVLFIRRLDTLPGPKTLPLIGNVSNVYHAFANCEDFMDLVLKFMEDYSSLCQVWIGSKLIIGIYNPDEVKTVLYSENCMDKAMLYKYIPLVGKMGLLTAPVPAWNRLRKMTGPTFSSDMLQGFFNTFVEQSIRLTDDLEKVGLNGNEIIYVDHVASCVFRIACDSLMGIQLEPNKNHQFVSLIERYIIFSSHSKYSRS
ncbi:PREDICTED: cytochrome P450 4C1-like [Wasmannia auropunctata]|uniref:cytochrome P450 4C1-like n=1 Tax=Wasmannia auropunctata TaxID=64793 RepID=UPI0005EF35AA|nr:PREDICTED: cytochrome P450 4C1-like [Wasmannia auropunctata]